MLLESLNFSDLKRKGTDFLLNYFSSQLLGMENVPQGGCLLVGNHSMLGWDSLVLFLLVGREMNRKLRFLGDRNLWDVPGLKRILDHMGAVPGTPDQAVQLLRDGELVCVYPGGVDDSWKLIPLQKYQLQWGTRSGFARVALEAQVPIVPVAGLGIDDMYTVWGREPWLGRHLFGSPRYDFPLFSGLWNTPLPKRVPLTFEFLSPQGASGNPQNLQDVQKLRDEVLMALKSRLKNASKDVF